MAKKGRKRWSVAALQMTSTPDVARNLHDSRNAIRRAARRGADLIALPENFAYLRKEGLPVPIREGLDGPIVTELRELAAGLNCYLLLGSFPERRKGRRRISNTSILIDPAGAIAATYRKLHLFDIAIRGGVTLKESKTVEPGAEVVVADTPLGKLGMSICYDLRFPELYRRQMQLGAQVLFVPAAFTAYTGPAHWLPLLRARAIENQCWVVAPAQTGSHHADRRSHGETVVIDPWGAVVARRVSAPGAVTATIDLTAIDRVRRGLPCADHVRHDLFDL
ncbi:MAG: carbon-nitrogen hydrolase family protein [Acidobacteriota bacterium]|nr:carbon-nitrogen hydrolase family protein [Acidobacteriota bacterium]